MNRTIIFAAIAALLSTSAPAFAQGSAATAPLATATVHCTLYDKRGPNHFYGSQPGTISYGAGQHPADIRKQVIEPMWRAYLKTQGVPVDALAALPYPALAQCTLLSSVDEARMLRAREVESLRKLPQYTIHELPWAPKN